MIEWQIWQNLMLGNTDEGYVSSVYHSCNFSVKLKLFQSKELKKKKKVAGRLVGSVN